MYKRNRCNANIDKLKQRLSEGKWHESLDNINVNDDYDKFIATFITPCYDECIPMKKFKINRKKDPMSPWIIVKKYFKEECIA